jgi:uncharacterized protein (DUF2147 family)
MRLGFLAFALVFMVSGVAALSAADNVLGLWKSVSEKTGQPETVTEIYEYQGKIYGRIVQTFDDKGQFKDNLTTAWEKATKYAGAPSVCGFDLIWALQDKGKDWEGTIYHPTEGNEYVCKLWKDGDKLIVRGQIKFLGIGRNQKWVPASEADLPTGYAIPDATSFVPVQPKKK